MNYWSKYFDVLSQAPSGAGSEFGVGAWLFGQVIAIQAVTVIEIGRFTGFSTVAIAGGLKFLDEIPIKITDTQSQRPDVDYERLLQSHGRKVISIDPNPRDEADVLINELHLDDYIVEIDRSSHEMPTWGYPPADLLLIDGDHTYEGCLQDVKEYVPRLRSGGYFVMHDYFGWYNDKGENCSPIKRVYDEVKSSYEHILIDTHFASFVVLRKP